MGPSVTARQAECIVGLLYAVLSAGTIRLTGDGQGLAAVWPANAVLLAALLDRRPDGWGRLLAAGYLANVATGLAMRGVGPAPFLDGLCHVAEAWIAARLLRPALNGEDMLVAPSVVGRFILVCGLVAPALSGLGGTAVASLVSGRDPAVAFGNWVTGNGLGLLVFTPFLFALLRGDYLRCLTGKDWGRRAEALALQGLVAATAYGVFCVAERSLLFVLFGPAMLATFRVGRLGTKAAVAVIAVIGTVATLRGQGPIAAVTPDPHEQATLLHAFLAVLLLTCLPVAAALTAQGRNLRSLSRSAESLRAQRAELARLAATDGLTGVLNRTAFREAALAAMRNSRMAPVSTPPSLIAIDLDLFKQVNDRHGHLAGDRALVHLVSVLRAGLREADTIGRVGGDEFLVLLPGTDADQAQVVAARLREALRRAPLTLDDGTALLLSMSCGVAPHRDGMGFEEVVHAADMALYGAKRARRETWMLSA
ncbi:diguanylate cyclase (GGDEF) domain-containing protein [Methylobacterium sp. ap11]|nr:diguanylate cyclase (GGDEF) domain-containing protein [Methylobacterium sp. ap11]